MLKLIKIIAILLFVQVGFAQSPLLTLMDGGYEPETLIYKTRVEADGGEIININMLNDFILNAKTNSYYDSLFTVIDANFGVKKNSNNKVLKVYDVMGVRDYAQTDTSKSPSWVTNANGIYAGLRFDGSNDQLGVTINKQGDAQPYTFFIYLKKLSAITNKNFIDNATNRVILGAASTTGKFFSYSGASLNDSTAFTANINYIFSAVLNNTSSKIYLNNVLKETGSAGTNRWGASTVTTEAYYLGSQGAAQWANIMLYGFIAKKGIGNITNINTFLNSKYSVY